MTRPVLAAAPMLDELPSRDARALAALDEGASGLLVSRLLADALDVTLTAHFRACVQQVFGAAPPFPVALLALGGLGRRERSPKSDIDVVLLHATHTGSSGLAALSNAFFYPLWDRRFEVGHGVRTVTESAELCTRDEAAFTAHLDARLLSGDAQLVEGLRRSCAVVFAKRGPAYIERLFEPVRERPRAKSHAFVLEPNLKTGAGGLRDLHQMGWVAGLRYGSTDLQALVERGVVSAVEQRQLSAARSFLLRLRALLHQEAGRRHDQLSFELQPLVAARIYRDGAPREQVERLLSRYYGHAQQVIELKHRLLLRVHDELVPTRRWFGPRRVAPGFVRLRGRLVVADKAHFEREPRDLVRAFLLSLEHALPLSDTTLDVLSASAELLSSSQAVAPRVAALITEDFWQLVAHPHGDRAFYDLLATGVLGRLLPEFARTRGMVQADFYHSYTVDVHSLRVVELLYALRRGEGPAEFTALAARETSWRTLVMAALFHDAGKRSGRPHEEVGAELVTQALTRLGAAAWEIEDAALLVREHLTMPKLSQRRDLSDAALIRSFAATVATVDRLRRLYILSYVDTHGTGPTLWTPWKAALLGELYRRTLRELSDELGPLPQPLAELPETWPARLRQVLSPAESESLRRLSAQGGGVALGEVDRGHRALLIVAKDRLGLLALFARLTAAHRVSIVAADLFSSTDGWALDRFIITDSQDGAAERCRDAIAAALAGEAPVTAAPKPEPVLRQRRVLLPDVRVSIGEQTSLGLLVDIVAPDRRGLLGDIAQAVSASGYSIRGARISTEGARAMDALYLEAHEGALEHEALLAALARAAALQ